MAKKNTTPKLEMPPADTNLVIMVGQVSKTGIKVRNTSSGDRKVASFSVYTRSHGRQALSPFGACVSPSDAFETIKKHGLKEGDKVLVIGSLRTRRVGQPGAYKYYDNLYINLVLPLSTPAATMQAWAEYNQSDVTDMATDVFSVSRLVTSLINNEAS